MAAKTAPGRGRHARGGVNTPPAGRHARPEPDRTVRIRERRAGRREERATLPQRAGRQARGAAADTSALAGRAAFGKGSQNAVMAELLIAVIIVVMRAAADYVPAAGGAEKGDVTPKSGQLGPVATLAGILAVFFLLSFAAVRGGTAGRLAAIGGAVVDLALLLKSMPEITAVAQFFGPPPAGQTAGPPGSGKKSGGAKKGKPVPPIDPNPVFG